MYEYLAYKCAVAGDLESEMAKPEIDDALFSGAGEILATLIAGQEGPAEAIDDYGCGAAVTESYLRHADLRANTLQHLIAVMSIKGFLSSDGGWDARHAAGWTPESRQRSLERATVIFSRPEWREKTLQALRSKDRVEFWNATESAKALGLDPWDEYFKRVSGGEDHWFPLLATADPARFERALELAMKIIPLEQIATGPAKQLGMGLGFAPHRHLDFVLQALANFPLRGWSFIRAGMESPVIRNRNMAIRALAVWPRAKWPKEAEADVRKCAGDEPDEIVRAEFKKLLTGQSPEPSPPS